MSEFERLFQLAIKRLARRERSLSEIRSSLEQAGAETEMVDAVLKRLVELRYVDEQRMAAAIIRDQRLQSRGPRSAWTKLKRRGISGWSLEKVEELWRSEPESLSSNMDEVAIAKRWVLRRYRKLGEPGVEGFKERQRALAALVRRGYSLAVAQRATREE